MVFANLAYNQSNLAHIKQQARSVAGKVNLNQFMYCNKGTLLGHVCFQLYETIVITVSNDCCVLK